MEPSACAVKGGASVSVREIVVAAEPERIMRNRDERVILVAPVVHCPRFVNARVPGISISRRKRAEDGGKGGEGGGYARSRCIHQSVIPFRFCRVAGGPRAR